MKSKYLKKYFTLEEMLDEVDDVAKDMKLRNYMVVFRLHRTSSVVRTR